MEDAYVIISKGECYLLNANIPVYQENGIFSHEPTRTRKLLLHKSEIAKFSTLVDRQGYTLVPVRVYIRHGLCKVQIALGKGKKNYDKRETIKEREDKIHMAKMMKGR